MVALKNGAQQLPNRDIEILCAYCDIVLADVHALECHNKSTHFTKTAYTCNYCTKYITHKCSLRSHLEICANAKAAKYDTANTESYFTVVPKNEKELKPNPNAKKEEKRTHHCTIDTCSRFFETKAKLNDHFRKCLHLHLFHVSIQNAMNSLVAKIICIGTFERNTMIIFT